jgi:transposase InsO family protein
MGRNALPITYVRASPRPIAPPFGAFYTRRVCREASQKKRLRRPIPVGRHRVQVDIQELPAIKGQRGREYKISVSHLRTRLKYSEIHPQATSRQVAAVLERSISRLPPFHLVVTDNAMVFTMAYTAHPERQTAFERTIQRLGLRHWRIGCRKPWQNGIIERSNRTDNDECFHQYTFTSSEERQYIHRLWEMHYNTERPHQGLGGQAPATVFQRDYPCEAAWMYAPTL